MKIYLELDHPFIREAAEKLAFHYRDYKFLEKVRAVKKFNHTNDTGGEVATKIKDSDLVIIVRPYRTWNPWSKVIGYAKGNIIFVNTRKLELPVRDRVNNFMHEALHLMGYSHKGNYVNEYNKGTVPYKVGDMFENYIYGEQG